MNEKNLPEASVSADATTGHPNRRDAMKSIAGVAVAVVGLTHLSSALSAGAAGSPASGSSLAALDKMAVKPTSLSMMPRLTYLGGPTYLIEIGNFRIISDPGFDPQGTERNEGPGHLLTKVMEPPIPVDEIGPIDLALISHAQHLDNLDNEGRRLLGKVGMTITTPASAAMNLPGKKVMGLPTWESTEITNAAGERLKITAMPAVHTSNPDLREIVGEVTGFMLEWKGQESGAFYISGDTVWIDEINEIAKRYKVSAAILHLGAANVPAVGDNYLTMNSADGARATKTLGLKNVYPAHFEGWRHFTQGAWYIAREFEAAGLTASLHLLRPGEAHNVPA
jgi:L-ascorbate metabolism protein UlaG (beta-lactamase superfamily)